MTLSALGKMIAVALKANCRCWKDRRKKNPVPFIDKILTFISQDLRAQVVQERDSARHLSLQKELELKELQARLEKKVKILFQFTVILRLIVFGVRLKNLRQRARLLSRRKLAGSIWKRRSRDLPGN